MEVIVGLTSLITLILGLVISVQGYEERDWFVVIMGLIIAAVCSIVLVFH